MSNVRLPLVITALALLSVGFAVAGTDPVTTYTREDLDRMFGPAPAGSSDPVDKSTPNDWRWVEQFLDRQYSRIDADRSYEYDRGVLDIAAMRTRPISPYAYGGSVAWGLGYPAYNWWNTVHSSYARGSSAPYHDHGGSHVSGRMSGHAGGGQSFHHR
jgi:hypothetical protein